MRRVGEQQTRHFDARLICASNQDLRAAVREGRLREDLYYRIKVVSIRLPPLRERPGDIIPLAEHFIDCETLRLGPNARKRLTKSAEEKLAAYSWPGNVRELKNVLRQAVLLSTGESIEPDNLILEEEGSEGGDVEMAGVAFDREGHQGAIAAAGQRGSAGPGRSDARNLSQPLRDAKRVWMKNYLENLLREVGGNISRAATLSGKHRSEVYQLIGRFNIDISRFRRRS